MSANTFSFRRRRATRSLRLGEDFHISNDRAFTWDQIHNAIGRSFDVDVTNVHVPTDTLTRYNPEWTGPLNGDKKWTALFDNSKIKSAVGQFSCSEDLDEILAESVAVAKHRLTLHSDGSSTSEESRVAGNEDALVDKIIADQRSLGYHVTASKPE